MQETKEFSGIEDMLKNWTEDQRRLKQAFLELREVLSAMKNTTMLFKARPGISYSIRASIIKPNKEKRRMFALIDIIDDTEKWLSVCFFDGTITDRDELGNMIPNGIVGEDGYCFDLEEYDDYLISYIKGRINEAYEKVSGERFRE